MKKLLFALAVVTSSAIAQPNTQNIQIQCDKHDKVLNSLQKDYKENILWIGKSKDLTYGLLANSTTKTWTIVLTDNNIMCVLGDGEGYVQPNPI